MTISDGRVLGGGKVLSWRGLGGEGVRRGESAHYLAGWLQVKSEY